MSERDASERIADLDPNHQVIDIGLAVQRLTVGGESGVCGLARQQEHAE